MPPTHAPLDADRWHFQHGPIDLVIGAEGDAAAVAAAHRAAWSRFQRVLDELVAELPLLRRPVDAAGACPVQGEVARAMWQACRPLATNFITPMAAVAGAVADAIVTAYQREGITRAWVNNGGDIALHLAPGASLRVGLVAGAHPRALALDGRLLTDGRFDVQAMHPVRGVATSGWRGRSFSLGVADSVTVLAASGAQADAAATVIANAVNVIDPRIVRQPACSLKDDSDLGAMAVTVAVPMFTAAQREAALRAGLAQAEALRGRGLIWHALLHCQGGMAATGDGSGQRACAVTQNAELGSVLA